MGLSHAEETESDEIIEQLVVFGVEARRFAVPIESVVEMTPLGDVEPIPESPPWIVGMMRLRESVLPVLDFRVRLGMGSLDVESDPPSERLRGSRDEHSAWLHQLLNALVNEDETKAEPLHPDSCEYGLWRQKMSIQDPRLLHTIEKVDAAHSHLHIAASSCLDMAAAADNSTAREAVETLVTGELQDFVWALDEFERQLHDRTRKMAVVLRLDNRAVSVAVDRIESVLTIEPDQSKRPPMGEDGAGGLIAAVIDTESSEPLIQVLDVAALFSTSSFGSTNPPLEDTQPNHGISTAN